MRTITDIINEASRNAKRRNIDIAKKMDFSKASVSIAMKKLKAKELITVNSETGNIELTAEGNKIAKEMFERHNLLYTVLVRLGVPGEIAIKDACKIEHDLSQESYEAIKNHLTKYEK
jgi:Mn-dependent DtxR family transcriptional regulator